MFITLDKLYAIGYNIKMKEIEVFKLNNKIPLQEWLDSLNDKTVKGRILERINRLQAGNFGDCKHIDSEISELRFQFGAGYRLYYSKINNILILLLCGGNKSTQTKDIQKAKEYLKIWKDNQNE